MKSESLRCDTIWLLDQTTYCVDVSDKPCKEKKNPAKPPVNNAILSLVELSKKKKKKTPLKTGKGGVFY